MRLVSSRPCFRQLSNFYADRCVHREPSSFSKSIIVTDGERKGAPHRFLTFGDAPPHSSVQGRVRLRNKSRPFDHSARCDYVNTMLGSSLCYTSILNHLSIDSLFQSDLKIASFGLGSGSIPDFFHRFTKASVEVVEIDPAVARVSETYFGFETSDRIRLHVRDANDWTLDNANRRDMDIIFVDIYNHEGLAMDALNQQMISTLPSLLSTDGIIISNVFSDIKNHNVVNQLLQKHLQHTHTLSVGTTHNVILTSFGCNESWTENNLDERGAVEKMKTETVTKQKLMRAAEAIAARGCIDFDIERVMQEALEDEFSFREE
ncbi:Spermine/spermidine synthase superfamily protein [Planoprotostelium fungivorum]|uniref:Spermine/spermidine synthase superfamily protein n=1 Tax=Planoprotostelium fungivorum TaxID=1890364 RepID=A0A2P6NC00_9EUKA|nr:Spermine/spermidine synthase superfamily protein [Planoprotostelium fungivorum]